MAALAALEAMADSLGLAAWVEEVQRPEPMAIREMQAVAEAAAPEDWAGMDLLRPRPAREAGMPEPEEAGESEAALEPEPMLPTAAMAERAATPVWPVMEAQEPMA